MQVPCESCIALAICKNKFMTRCSILSNFLEEASNKDKEKAKEVHLIFDTRVIRWELDQNRVTIFGSNSHDRNLLRDEIDSLKVNLINHSNDHGHCKYFVLYLKEGD